MRNLFLLKSVKVYKNFSGGGRRGEKKEKTGKGGGRKKKSLVLGLGLGLMLGLGLGLGSPLRARGGRSAILRMQRGAKLSAPYMAAASAAGPANGAGGAKSRDVPRRH